VVNTDLHFIFTDCYLDGIDGTWCGLYLANVTNGVIRNTIVRNSAISFHMVEIYNCTMTNNELYDNYHEGIVLELACFGNNITVNRIYDNAQHGILLDFGCENNIVTGNEIYDNGGNGIYIWPDSATLSANNNLISNNTILRQSNGISVQGYENRITDNTITYSYSSGILCGGESNIVVNNTMIDSRRDGIKLYSYASNIQVTSNSIQNSTNRGIKIGSTCDFNSVMYNDLIENNISCQVWDDGENNTVRSNYYSTWNAPDEDGNGSVDIAYPVGGDAETVDSSPSTQPYHTIPDWYTYSQVSGVSSTDAAQQDDDFLFRMFLMVTIVAIAIPLIAILRRKTR
jgi:parallel beta-helix repeat protein